MTALSRRHFLRLLSGTSTFPLIPMCSLILVRNRYSPSMNTLENLLWNASFRKTTSRLFVSGGKRRMFWMIFGARCHDEEDFAKLRGKIHNYVEYGLERIFSQRMISTAGPRRMVHLEQAWANDGGLARRSAAQAPAAGSAS